MEVSYDKTYRGLNDILYSDEIVRFLTEIEYPHYYRFDPYTG